MLSFVVCANIGAWEKPNVILILVDDMGYSDIGCYGGEKAGIFLLAGGYN